VAEKRTIKEDSVETLLGIVRDLLKDEENREQSFNTRAGGLASFVGLIVSVTTAAGKLALDGKPSHAASVWAAIFFAVSMLALVGSLAMAVTRVLLPQSSAAIGLSTIKKYPTWHYVSRDKVEIEGELMRGLITTLTTDRDRNDSKSTWLRRAYISFLAGIVALLAFGSILALDALGRDRGAGTGGAAGQRSTAGHRRDAVQRARHRHRQEGRGRGRAGDPRRRDGDSK
jgi:hypothetical protein